MAKLTFILEDGQEVEVPLTETITIGRSEGNSVVVDDDLISPNHAEILITLDGRMQVIEVDAGTGTFVNDLRVQSYPLRHGDRLAFGPLVALLDAQELPVEGDIVATNANQEALAVQEKRLTELQEAAEDAAARQAALIMVIQSLVAEEEEKTATLKQLDLAHESVIHALKELTDQQEKEALCLKRLGEEKTQEEQRLVEFRQLVAAQEKNDSQRLKLLEDQSKQTEKIIIGFNRQTETLKLNCHELETLAAKQQSQVDAVSAEILKREQQALEVKQDLLAAEAKLAQKLVENKLAEERNVSLSANLAALQEEYEELTELVEDLQQQLALHKADLIEQTRLVEIAKERHSQLEENCRRLAINKQPPQEISQDKSIPAETKATKVVESVPDLSISSLTTNRIVPRMVSSETHVPRPRGIPMKSERITRRGSPFPNKADS